MSKRKKSDVDASRKEWDPFIKILEKPDVSNCLLEYLCSLNCDTLNSEKKSVHRKWIDTIIEISKKHSSIPIQKLAKKSVDNFKVVIILFKDNFLYRIEQKLEHSICIHPQFWMQGKILCFQRVLPTERCEATVILCFHVW